MPAPRDPRQLPPGAASIALFLARLDRRRRVIAAAQGASAGLILAAATIVVVWRSGGPLGGAIAVAVAIIIAAIAARMIGVSAPRPRIAELAERRSGGCRNLIVTAAELIDRPRGTVRADIETRVFRDAERAAARLEPARIVPARNASVALAAGAAVWASALVLIVARPARPAAATPVLADAVAIEGVELTVTPPAYAGGRRRSLRDPARVEALAGSTIAISVRAIADSVTIETISDSTGLRRGTDREFVGEVVADGDGYIAIDARTSDGRTGARRLIGLTVTPDRPPRVRLTAPGRDLFLADAGRTLDLAVEADDDLGLASLRLRYTKVSGSGEQFTFTDGELPLRIVRTSQLMWRAQGTLPLAPLGLQPGDVVVYRGVATDRRPGASPVESDAFLVEITSPGAVASEGFAMDDEEDRYAVSQQMVILKTERLLERRRAMSAEAVREEALGIAAEQRRVRAEFVFMMGGELAEQVTGAETGISELHEEAEAEAGDDILAGRLANRGRVELNLAIRSMSQAAAALVGGSVDEALTDERRALEHLQRAFSRTRYILRALTERERLDLARRLTGTLADAARHQRPIAPPPSDSTVAAYRRALSQIAALAADDRLDADDAFMASTIAQGVLRIDPSSPALQRIAAGLTDASVAIAAARMDDARTQLDRAATELTATVRVTVVPGIGPTTPVAVDRLAGAIVDALRRSGVRR